MPTIDQRGQHVNSQVFIDKLNITKLSQLDEFDESTKRKLANQYEVQVRQSSEKAQYHLALGLFYLDRRLYPLAARALELAQARDPLNGNILYYLALAYISGSQLGVLRLTAVRQIEECLKGAAEIGAVQAHYLYLWALLKYDYYLTNGLEDSPPTIIELLELAQEIPLDPDEIRHMLSHLRPSDSPVLNVLLSRCGPSRSRGSSVAYKR